jgi:hypothetical protein
MSDEGLDHDRLYANHIPGRTAHSPSSIYRAFLNRSFAEGKCRCRWKERYSADTSSLLRPFTLSPLDLHPQP